MAATPEQDGRKARLVAIVLIVTMILWLGLQAVGGAMGWNARYAFLFDLAALAAFIWALVVTYQIWRTRRGSRG
jgi:cell division protein FtsB